MFFNNKAVIFVRRNSLELFAGGEGQILQFPPGVYQNLEILDQIAFEKQTGDFFARLKKQKTVIVLSEELVFEKEIAAEDETDSNNKYQQFLSALPISKEKQASKRVINGEKIYLLATNKKIYEAVKSVVEGLGWEVKAVVAETLFNEFLGIDEVNPASVKKIVSQKELIKACDFLTSSEELQSIKKASHKKTFIILGLFLLLLTGMILVSFRFGLLNFQAFREKKAEIKKETSDRDSTGESSQSAKEASSSAQVGKEELKVQILNGSGVAGQAKKLKDEFVKMGFENIEVGDSDETANEETIVIFSQKVTLGLEQELVPKLEEIFEKVNTKESTKEEFDITITTGKYK